MSEEFDPIESAIQLGSIKAEVATLPPKLRPIGEKMIEMAEAVLRMKSEHLAEVAALKSELHGYRAWGEEVTRLTRELDVAMHGDARAARQSSLCDLVAAARAARPTTPGTGDGE